MGESSNRGRAALLIPHSALRLSHFKRAPLPCSSLRGTRGFAGRARGTLGRRPTATGTAQSKAIRPNPTKSNLIGLIRLIRPIILAAGEPFGAIAAASANEPSNFEL